MSPTESLGDWIGRAAIELSESFANFVIHNAADHAKIATLAAAFAVPGFCHTHLPCTAVIPGCLYCERHGNVFAPPENMPPRSSAGGGGVKVDPTLLDEFQSKFAESLLEFADKILEVVKRNAGADADAIREQVRTEIKKRFYSGDEPDD